MALIPVLPENPPDTIGDADFIPAATGQQFSNDGVTVLYIKNDGADTDVTVIAQGQCDQGFLHDELINLPASGVTKTIMFPISRFGRQVSVTWGRTSGVSVVGVRQAFVRGS